MESVMSKSEQNKSILYIEDNPANLRLVEQILMSLPDIKMLSAIEPLSGLELVKQHSPDLILLDINLPEMSGYEVIKQLKTMDESVNTPVVAISANAMPKDIQQGKDAGFDAYITKPIDVKDLLFTVEKILSDK